MAENLSRGTFIRGGLTTALAATVCGTQGAYASEASGDILWETECDAIVLGGGNGGLSAAARLAENGKSVILLEASNYLGGGSVFAGGGVNASMHIFGTKDWKTYNEENAYTAHSVDPEIGESIITTFYGDYVEWLEDNDIALHKTEGTRGYQNDWMLGWGGEPGKSGNIAYFDSLEQFALDMGAQIVRRMFGQKLLLDSNGTIVGVQAVSLEDGSIKNYKTCNVVLATGGFQNNKGLMACYVGPGAEMMRNIGGPYNTGAGLLMATSVGAITAGRFHHMASELCAYKQTGIHEEDPDLFETARSGDPEQCFPGIELPNWPHELQSMLLNMDGKRIRNTGDDQLHLYQRDYQLLAVCDQTSYNESLENWNNAVYKSADEAFDDVMACGGFYIEGDTLEEFAQNVQNAMIFTDAQQVINSITEYNEAVEAGTAWQLDPPATGSGLRPLVAPFRAVLCVLGTYYMQGGLKINRNAQVIGCDLEPIPGLYATVPCAGTYSYLGGIAAAGTSGYLAANHISA